MDPTLTRLTALHRLAARFGDGLKPELLALLERPKRQMLAGAEPLAMRQVSSGPRHQFATKGQLDAQRIPVLDSVRTLEKRRGGATG